MSSVLTQWSSDFENGIVWQDQQHEELLKAIHRLYHAVLNKESDKAIDDILDFLGGYTKNHFDMEEKYMETYHYPDMDSHIFQHRSFIKMLDDFQKERSRAKTMALLALCYYLNDWTINHIKTVDQNLAHFLSIEGVA